MALMTLVEYAKGLEKTDPRRAYVETFAASADFYEALPIEGMTGSTYEYFREAELGSSGFRGINEDSGKSQGRFTPHQESSFIIDTDLDVDRAIVDRYGPERRAREESLQLKSVGQLFATTFIKGDNTSEPREFNGLQKRCTVGNERLFHNSGASGGAALSLLELDKLINSVKDCNALLMPYDFQPLLIQAARNTALTGFVIQSWDEIGMAKMTYAGRRIYFGYGRDKNTPPLDFNEVASGGGGAVTCSIYAVNMGENGVRGVQVKPMEADDVGLLESRIKYRTHVSWDIGLVDEHPYCVSRLTSVTNAKIVE